MIKQLFCKHDYEFNSTISGDMIIHMSYNRSIWKCTKCKKYIMRKEYVDKDMLLNINRKKKLKQLLK